MQDRKSSSNPAKASHNTPQLALAGLAAHLVGFVLGYAGEGLVLQGIVGIDSGIAKLAPFGDTLYALGLALVILSAGRALVPLRYILVGAVVIGVGFFYKSAPHEIHLASGLGFGLNHPQHIGLGAMLITISVVAIAVITLRSRHKPIELTE